MSEKFSSETLLIKFFNKYNEYIREDVVKFSMQDIEHNECGLAYDAIIFEIENGFLLKNNEIIEDVIKIANSLNIQYPKLSTD